MTKAHHLFAAKNTTVKPPTGSNCRSDILTRDPTRSDRVVVNRRADLRRFQMMRSVARSLCDRLSLYCWVLVMRT